MAIAFRSISSIAYASRTDTVLTAPAGIVNGDILMLQFALGGSAPPTPTLPAGFTQIDTSTQTVAGFNVIMYVAWKRAASESGSYTISHSASPSQGVMAVYSGCKASGSPVDVYSKNIGLGVTATATSVTTTAAGDILLYVGHDWTGSGALNPPAGMTERFDGLEYLAEQQLGAAGATSNRTMTTGNSAPDGWGAWLVVLLSAAGGADVIAPSVPTGLSGVALSDSGIETTPDSINEPQTFAYPSDTPPSINKG